MIALVVFLVVACVVSAWRTSLLRSDARADVEIAEFDAWIAHVRADW